MVTIYQEDQFLDIKIFGKPALMTDSRIDRESIPNGLYAYDLRGSDYDPEQPVTVENSVCVNFVATVITSIPLLFNKKSQLLLGKDGLDYCDGDYISLQEFCQEQGVALP